MNVTALPYPPFWDEKEGPRNTTRYSGLDYNTLTSIAGALNFTPHVLPSSSWAEVRKDLLSTPQFHVIYALPPL